MIHKEGRIKTQFSLSQNVPNYRSRMPGSLVPSFLHTVQFRNKFPGIIESLMLKEAKITLKLKVVIFSKKMDSRDKLLILD